MRTVSAVNVLIGIMEAKRSPPATRVAAATALLDRGWGKPPLSVTGKDGDDDIRITIREIVETARGREKEGDEDV
jgi:hypothetical protein